MGSSVTETKSNLIILYSYNLKHPTLSCKFSDFEEKINKCS